MNVSTISKENGEQGSDVENMPTPLFTIRTPDRPACERSRTYNTQHYLPPPRPDHSRHIILHAPEQRDELEQRHKLQVRLTASPEDTYVQISRTIEKHDRLERHHELLKAAIQDGSADMDYVHILLKDEAQTLSDVRAFLQSCLDSIPLTMRFTTRSTVNAEKVFNTAELVEAILSFLSPFDILSTVQTNRCTSKAVSNSPILQEILHLRPSKEGYIASVLDDERFTNIRVNVTDMPEDLDFPPGLPPPFYHYSDTDADLDADFDESELQKIVTIAVHTSQNAEGEYELPPKIGPLCRRMLVCQPPITELRYYPDCCNAESPFRYSFRQDAFVNTAHLNSTANGKTIAAENGLTIGDIYDAASSTMLKHRLCPRAREEFHDAEGFVNPVITFQAAFKARPGDPYMHEQIKECSQSNWATVEDRMDSGILRAYMTAKQEANRMRLPIPTFAEFKADPEDITTKHKGTQAG